MKSILIIGASGGIGSAIARTFAEKGYALALHYHSNKEKAEETAKNLRNTFGVPVMTVGADISCPNQVRAMADRTAEQLGHIDVLVNNAGIAEQRLFTDITDEQWRAMLSVNLDGVFYTSREVLRLMLARHSGSIVNISSMWGQVGASCEVHYSAAKAGVIGLTKALAKEVAPSGIRVNCVAPGAVDTEMMSTFSDDEIAAVCEETPLGRLASPKEIADAVFFLADEKASFITGQVIGVNGGMVI